MLTLGDILKLNVNAVQVSKCFFCGDGTESPRRVAKLFKFSAQSGQIPEQSSNASGGTSGALEEDDDDEEEEGKVLKRADGRVGISAFAEFIIVARDPKNPGLADRDSRTSHSPTSSRVIFLEF